MNHWEEGGKRSKKDSEIKTREMRVRRKGDSENLSWLVDIAAGKKIKKEKVRKAKAGGEGVRREGTSTSVGKFHRRKVTKKGFMGGKKAF